MSEPKLNIKEETSAKKTRSPPKKAKVEQTVPKKKKLKTDADKAAEKAQHLRFGKAELTPDELSRLSKAQKREMYAAHAARSAAHHEVDQYEDDNVGTQALSEGEKAAGNVRDISKSRYARKLKRKAKMQGKKGARNAKSSVQKPTAAQDTGASGTGEGGSNWLSRWRQKQAIKKEYAAAKAGAAAAENTASGTAKAAQGTVSITEKAFQFVQSHSHIIIGIAAVGLLVLVIAGSVSSCSVLINGGGNVVLGTSYTAEDEDLKGVETDYTRLEDKLRKQIDRIETDHPGYDEYRYNLAEIGHNPYELASLLTVEFENYTRSQVQARLQSIFEAQYELKLEEKVEIRTRKETRMGYRYNPITGTGHTYTYQVTVQYEYKILNVTLLNRGVDYVARNSGLTDDQLQRYEVTLECRGNRDDLFAGIAFATPDGAGSSGEYQDYDIPGEALTDEKFRKMITEAEKYLGYPYVWGGSSPSTSFDCSGFVSWVINHCGNGWNVGRQTANGLMGKCDIIPKSEAKPGDLIFFQKTYNTSGASHVGIYVGNGMMIHCGSPISYASIETSYWRQHYYCMGRIR